MEEVKEVNQDRVYINLRVVDKQLVMNVSRTTLAARNLKLSCGDVLFEEQAVVSLVTIEYCQLTFKQLRAYMTNLGLSREDFCARYAVSPKQLEEWEKQ